MGSGGSDKAAAKRLTAESVRGLENIDTPDIEKQKLFLQQLISQGDYNPQMEQYLGDVSSELENIDPRLKAAQMSALEQMINQSDKGAITDADMAQFNLSRRDVNADVRNNEKQILQNMAQRGMQGSGDELMSLLNNTSSGTDRLSEAADKQAFQALDRQLQGLSQQTNMAGNVRNQDMSQANALDALAQYNLMNKQNLAGRNVENRNKAQQMNLGEKQRLSDQNIGLSNQQQQYNKGLTQQQYQNEIQKQQAVAAAKMGQAQQYTQSAQQSSEALGNAIGAGGKLFGSIYGSQSADGKPTTTVTQAKSSPNNMTIGGEADITLNRGKA